MNEQRRIKIIGLTGQSGAGKGAFCDILKTFNIAVIDADKVYHSLLISGTECVNELYEFFGSQIIDSDGNVDRKQLAKIVFADDGKDKLKALNSITHKHVFKKTIELINQYENDGFLAVTVDAPLLFEAEFDKICDVCISVLASQETRLKRIIDRDGLSEEAALARLRAQNDDSYYIERSDYVITNDSTLEELKNSATRVISEILGI